MINFTSFALALYKKLSIKALMATDLPDPVVPAIKTCGILPRSATTGFPEISLPSAMVVSDAVSANVFELIISER